MTEHIEQAHWEAFLNDFSKTHQGFAARRESMGRDVGDQAAAAGLPCTGISYDPHHRQIFSTVGGSSSHSPVHLTHTLASPRTVAVRDTPAGEVSSLLMTAEDNPETRVTLWRHPQLAR